MKLKAVLMEHYIKAIETEIDGITVRVMKPRTMGVLPSYSMLDMIRSYTHLYSHYPDEKCSMTTGNPDYGAWDMQIVVYKDPRRKTIDIYVCSLLCRPFSREAYEHYGERMGLEPTLRLALMWDSREFDRRNGFDTNYGTYGECGTEDDHMYDEYNRHCDIADRSGTWNG